MNKTFFISIFISILLLSSCKNKSATNIELNYFEDTTSLVLKEQVEESIEDFDTFFLYFQNDSVFQVSRIKFPLKYYIYDFDLGIDSLGEIVDLTTKREVIFNKDEWVYESFNQYKKRIFKVGETEYDVELQIIDTGVSITYTFKFSNNNKWYLIEVKDEST
jgi:hypothetical protein